MIDSGIPIQDQNNWRRVSEWVDIAAPRVEVFALLINLERRMQLSPLWGLSKIERLDENYPEVGSCYHVRFVKGSPVEYDTVITELVPGRKLAYRLEAPQKTEVTWSLQDTSRGTRLTYTETFLVDEINSAPEREELPQVKDIGSNLVGAILYSQKEQPDFIQTVQGVVKAWLKNIQRYAELSTRQHGAPDRGLQLSKDRLVFWLLNNFYLKLRNDQRKVVQVILLMQVVSLITFIMAALAYSLVGLTHLVF